MNKTLRVSLIIIIVLIGSVALIWTGYRFGLAATRFSADGSYSYMMDFDDQKSSGGYGWGSGMMGGSGYGMMGPGMMGGYYANSSSTPISVDDARDAVESYLLDYGEQDLVIEEIMVFDNNAYAIVIEESTGIGAFELLVDPVTKAVFPEFGPNMMWNLKYGMMGSGMMGGWNGSGMMDRWGGSGMMGGFGNNRFSSKELDSVMSVSKAEALEIAQDFLDQVYPGTEVSDEITQFYGYYTIDTERDGVINGMLSVNGYTGQVFPHTWHGEFVEMVEG